MSIDHTTPLTQDLPALRLCLDQAVAKAINAMTDAQLQAMLLDSLEEIKEQHALAA